MALNRFFNPGHAFSPKDIVKFTPGRFNVRHPPLALDQGKRPDGFVILKFPVTLHHFVSLTVNQVILHIGGYRHHQLGALMGDIIVAVNEKQRADRPDLFDCTDIAQAFPVPSVQMNQLLVLPIPVG